MTELAFAKTPSGALAPADESTREFMAKIKVGAGLRSDFKRMRDVVKHRRAFALFKLAFDMWDAPELEYAGQRVQKSFDRFRRDLTILAGHYTSTINLRGDVRLEAKSLSFGNMDDTEFEGVYRDVLTAVWKHVLAAKGYGSAAEVDRVVDELMRFE